VVKLTDLERDLGSGPIAKPILLRALRGLSNDSKELIELRYDYIDSKRVRLAGDFVEEFGWKPRETSERILAALAELNKHIRGISEGDYQENTGSVSRGEDEGFSAVG
jgi:hypothetical protein